MEENYNLCLEIIRDIKKYMERKDYTGLQLYLDEKEKNIENCHILSKSEEEKYIDSLVKELDHS